MNEIQKWRMGLSNSALALLFLAMAVMVVASALALSVRQPAGASAGSIFVANEWSRIANESPAPSGYTSRPTVYATYNDGVRLIQADADLIKVIVKDADADALTGATATNIAVGTANGGSSTYTAGPGVMQTVFLVSQTVGISPGSPIAGGNETIQVMSGGVDLVAFGALTITNRFSGNSANDPWISLQNNFATVPFTIDEVRYKTSAVDQVAGGITVTSDLEPTGITIQADETGRSTGIFHGFVRIVDSLNTSTGSTGAGPADAGVIRASSGTINFSFVDTDLVTRETTVTLDTSAPSPAVTGPAHGSGTQNRRPVFSGSISDTGSGLDISSIIVAYDNADDPFNTFTEVIDTSNSAFSGTADFLAISTSGAVDGDLAFSFSEDPGSNIPGNAVPPVDHIVDWVVKASDIAGNIGLSDADPARAGVQLHTVKIDQVIPTFSTRAGDNRTGRGWDGSDEVIDRKSIRIVFNDMVVDVQPSDFIVTLDSGATVVPVTTTVVNNPPSFPDQGVVYLGFKNELISNETPWVSVHGAIKDISGNSTSTGSASVFDGIRPKITVTTSGGSGIGAGDEGPGGLTDDQMTITITSDEPLNSTPSVFVFPVGAPGVEMTPTVISVGANEWEALYDAPAGFTTGDRAIVVSGSDTSGNTETVGDNDIRTFTLDRELQEPVIDISPMDSGDVVSATPDIAVDFTVNGEISSVTISELLIDGNPVGVTPISVEDGKKLVFQISSPLTAGQHTLTIPAGAAADAAGNINSVDIETTFEVTIPEVVTISLSPDAVSVRGDEPAVVTVSVADLGANVPDTVQINLQHDDSVIVMESPSCVDIFDGGQASAVNRDQTDTGSWFVCTLVGGATGPSGDVATFELRRVGDGNPTLALGTTGATGSAFFEGGAIISSVSTDTLEILPGTRVQGHVTIQGVTDESAFELIGPEITLTPVSGGNPAPVTVQVESDGTFAFDAVLDGVYDLTLDAPGTLGRHMTGLVVGTDDVTLQTVELRGGIVNDDDDQVTGADVSVVTSNFGAGPSALSDRATADGDIVDFDGDGFVTGFDISVVMSNVNESRLQEWTDPAQSP